MSYRGVYRDGVVVFEGRVDLRNGEAVEVSSAGDRNGTHSPSVKRRTPKAKPRRDKTHSHPLLALAGLWKDRADWRGKSSVQVVAELRERVENRKPAKRRRRG